MATLSLYSCSLSLKFFLVLSIYLPTVLLRCDAGRIIEKHIKELKRVRHYSEMLDSAYGIGTPFSLPPFESLGPVSLPQQGQTTPPYCINPPFTPTPTNPFLPPAPSLDIPPIPPILSPPSSSYPSPSIPSSNPNLPGQPPFPPTYVPITPPSFEPSPPSYTPTPGIGGGSSGGSGSGGTPRGGGGGSGGAPGVGGGFVPSPPVFQPPVIYPPPAVPPPPHHGESMTLWCVAKPSVPDPILQEAMNYACGSGADCNQMQPNGNCYQPNTVLAHASYAFNSYWQMTKVGGGTCEFGGTAILVTVDPSHDGCHYIIT